MFSPNRHGHTVFQNGCTNLQSYRLHPIAWSLVSASWCYIFSLCHSISLRTEDVGHLLCQFLIGLLFLICRSYLLRYGLFSRRVYVLQTIVSQFVTCHFTLNGCSFCLIQWSIAWTSGGGGGSVRRTCWLTGLGRSWRLLGWWLGCLHGYHFSSSLFFSVDPSFHLIPFYFCLKDFL